MTDTIKPNGDRPCDGEAAKNLRELTAELGFWPATTNPDDIERHREHTTNADFWLARSHRYDHLKKSR